MYVRTCEGVCVFAARVSRSLRLTRARARTRATHTDVRMKAAYGGAFAKRACARVLVRRVSTRVYTGAYLCVTKLLPFASPISCLGTARSDRHRMRNSSVQRKEKAAIGNCPELTMRREANLARR